MAKKMLIDAAHPEETRVAIVDENTRLIDYDFESTTKKTFKGNIYLAKIARVEPSLQAAFVDYGGDRHGFLAFSEIHPDYFRIPIADRQTLEKRIEEHQKNRSEHPAEFKDNLTEEGSDEDASISTVGGELDVVVDEEDDEEGNENYRPPLHRLYKIQEVIKKNQILLVQVAKEERGGKGAALTTYISMAGRYCVLMPNSPKSGGISRKIANSADRKRLRSILDGLDTPDGMGLIIRTAGMERTKIEIKRDAEYLMRTWNEIRASTLESIAPCLIYQEDEIIKRAIRDLYSKDIEEVEVEGEEGYKTAKTFMKTLMPSHSKRVKLYKHESMPLFFQAKIEKQIDEMHSPTVRLPSGGSIVIHPTEALVSIDINSGRATRERHIEETALKTNLEAAEEIYRQVRLRDLAGLIVIDFIDMDNSKNTANVERRVREIFRNDRARVQIGKISPFGLLELSRQRLKPSILETASAPCPHCQATGYVRSTESISLMILRTLEEEGYIGKSRKVSIKVPYNVAFYILNQKRDQITEIQKRHNIEIFVEGDDKMIVPNYLLTRLEEHHDKKPEVIEAGVQQPQPLPQPMTEERRQDPNQPDRNRRRKKRRKPHPNQQQSHGGPDDGNRNRPPQTQVSNDHKPHVETAPAAAPIQDQASQEAQPVEGDGSTPQQPRSPNRNRNRHRRNRHKRFNPRFNNPQKDENAPPQEGGAPVENKQPAPTPAPPVAETPSVVESQPSGDGETPKPKRKSKRSWLKRLIE